MTEIEKLISEGEPATESTGIITTLESILNEEPAEEGAGMAIVGAIVTFLTISGAISTFKNNRKAKKLGRFNLYSHFAKEQLSKTKYFKYYPRIKETFETYFANAEKVVTYWKQVEEIIKNQTSMEMEDYEENRNENIEKINHIRQELIRAYPKLQTKLTEKIDEVKKDAPIINTEIKETVISNFSKFTDLIETYDSGKLFAIYFANSKCKDEFHAQYEDYMEEDDYDYCDIREPFFDACVTFVNSYGEFLTNDFDRILATIKYQVKGNGKDIKKASMDSTLALDDAADNEPDVLTAVLESTLTAAERRQIPTDQFGLPTVRKYPLNDEAHVKQAITKFVYAKGPVRKELATNIVKRMKTLGMPMKMSEKALVRKYLSKELNDELEITNYQESSAPNSIKK